MATEFDCFHFSQANPAGDQQDDLPALLRRVAETIESLGSIQVQDLVLHTEVTEFGPWQSVTVYYGRREEPSVAGVLA